MEDRNLKFGMEFVDPSNTEIFSSAFQETEFINDKKTNSNSTQELQNLIEKRQNDWHAKLRHSEQLTKNEINERVFLVEQIRRQEDKNAALSKQLNELFGYCESLYNDVEGRRKEAELRVQQVVEKLSVLEDQIAKKDSQIMTLNEKLEQKSLVHDQSQSENTKLKVQLLELSNNLERQRNRESFSLSSLQRGKLFIESSIRSINDFQMSFQSYLNSLNKDGVSPISLRTGKIFAETWKIQSEDLKKTAEILMQLME